MVPGWKVLKKKSTSFLNTFLILCNPNLKFLAHPSLCPYLPCSFTNFRSFKPIRIKQIRTLIQIPQNEKALVGILLMVKLQRNFLKSLRLLTILMNRMLSLNYVPKIWKLLETILLPNPGKNIMLILTQLFSIVPFVCFHTFRKSSKVAYTWTSSLNSTASARTSLRSNKHIEWSQRWIWLLKTNCILRRKVWHEGLLAKLRITVPKKFVLSQGSVLGPILCIIYTPDWPITSDSKIATFADVTASWVLKPLSEIQL